jgi:tetratricopeptide (TPR) repeat protein
VVNHLVKVEAAKAHSIINKAMKSMTSRSESEDEVDTPKRSFISKWFGVASADETDHTVMSGESEYSSEDDYESGSSYDDESTATNEAFDRKLRAKHTKACKYMRNGDFKNALTAFEGILASLSEAYGEEHYRVGAALHNVGIANLRAGKLDDAMASIEEAVRMRKKTLGATHPKVADSLVELGIIHLSLNEYDEALKVFSEALHMREEESREISNITESKEAKLKEAKVLNNIGCVHFEREDSEEALHAFDSAVKLQRSALQTESRNFSASSQPASKPSYLTMACTLCNKGYAELELNMYEDAINTFKESLKLQRQLLSPENPLVMNTMDNLGFAYTMNRKYGKAAEVYSELLTAQEAGNAGDKVRINTFRKIVYVQLAIKDNENALESLRELESIELDLYGTESRQWKETHRLMGLVNYEVLKHPMLPTFACFNCGSDNVEEMNLHSWVPRKPTNGSKMSGHRVTYA